MLLEYGKAFSIPSQFSFSGSVSQCVHMCDALFAFKILKGSFKSNSAVSAVFCWPGSITVMAFPMKCMVYDMCPNCAVISCRQSLKLKAFFFSN